jgi:hypothetical protein
MMIGASLWRAVLHGNHDERQSCADSGPCRNQEVDLKPSLGIRAGNGFCWLTADLPFCVSRPDLLGENTRSAVGRLGRHPPAVWVPLGAPIAAAGKGDPWTGQGDSGEDQVYPSICDTGCDVDLSLRLGEA